MSKAIASLLDQPEHTVKKVISKLEDKNGYPSHDVRQLAQNIQKTRDKISDLGLDPSDTTGEELYHSLLVKFQTDSQKFDAQNSLDSDTFAAKAAKAIQLVSSSLELPQRWVLKNSCAKTLLRQQPPKHVMKSLNYRSIDSLLKREHTTEVLSATSLSESASWQKDFNKLVSKQDSTHFELRPLSLCSLSYKKWGQTGDIQPLSYNDQAGTLAVVETPESTQPPLLSIVVLLVDELKMFKPLNLSKEVAKLSPALAWWSDMDGLICSLNSEAVSCNLKDISQNVALNHNYSDRLLDSCRGSFWQELLNRYDNQLETQEDLIGGLKQRMASFAAPINQPAFEYVEDY